MRLSVNVNLILYRRDRACPCPQQISYKIKFMDNRKGCPYGCANILISYQPKIIIYQQQSNGGSKPPPYNTIWYKFTFTDNRIFSLPCVKGCGSPVETSAFNAEAPTEPAGETVGCRKATRRDCKVDFMWFYKNPSVIFLFQKNDSSLYKGAFNGQPQALSLRDDIEFNFDSSR